MSRRPVLVVTDFDDVHADAVIEALNARDWPVFRLNTSSMATEIVLTFRLTGDRFTGVLENFHHRLILEDCGSVWFRRPAAPQANPAVAPQARLYAQEQFDLALRYLNGVVESKWINHPLRNCWADNKLVQLRAARDHGLQVPATLITNSPDELQAFRHALSPRTAAVKCIEMSLEANKALGRQHTTQQLPPSEAVDEGEVRLAPVMVQPFIPKAYELRCTVIGRCVYAAKIDSQANSKGSVDWRAAVDFNEKGIPMDLNRYEPATLPAEAERSLISVVDHFGLRFAAIDMIVTPAGEHVFLELNPNGQWLWIETQTGMPLVDAMVDELTS